MSGMNGMLGGNSFNGSPLPMISSSHPMHSQNGRDTSSMYNTGQGNSYSTPYSQRRSETPSEQSSSFIMSEIKNMKQLIKATYESQTEMQFKIIEYNRIISQQENIIRLNNIKLSEHDSKLTDILLSFDNYLKLHDKSTKIVNEVQRRLDNSVSISDYSEFKSNYYSTKAVIDNQIASLYHTNEETQMKLSETTKENKTLQEYIIDKVKAVENNLTHTVLDFQRNSIQIQEAKESSLKGQFSHLKSLIQMVESNVNEEVKCRKSALESLKVDIIGLFKQYDEKLSRMEKSQLETEKNLICLNKDYVGTFQDLLSNQKDKSDIEMSSLRSLVEAGLAKTKMGFDESLSAVEERMSKLTALIEEQRTTYADLEEFVKDSVKTANEGVDSANKAGVDSNLKFDTLNRAFNAYIAESKENARKMQQAIHKEMTETLNKEVAALEERTLRQIESNTKGLSDLTEKTAQMTTTLQLLSRPSNKGKDEQVEVRDLSALNLQLEDFRQGMIEVEARLKKEIGLRIDEQIPKNRTEAKVMLDAINDRVEKVIEVLKADLMTNSEAYQSTVEGRLQGLIVESETRINEHFNKEIGAIQEAIEMMILKFGNKKDEM